MMRKFTVFSVVLGVSFLLAANGMAQQGEERLGLKSGQQLQWPQKSSDILEKKIISEDGKEIGTAKDLVIGTDGKIEYVILSTGGVLGIGGDKIAIPWERFRSTGNIDQLTVDVTQAEIQEYAGKKKSSSRVAATEGGRREQPMPLANVSQEDAKQFANRKVVGKNGQELGEVKDLVAKDNRPLYVVVQDETRKLHPVPAQLVRTNPCDQKSLTADLDKQAFLASPSIDPTQLSNQQQWESEVRGYFSQSGAQGGQPGQQQSQ